MPDEAKTVKPWKTFLIRILLSFFVIYLAQLFIVMYWKIVPIARKEHAGNIYTIRHGFGGMKDFVPLAGLLSLSGESVVLAIENERDGVFVHREYDLAIDVYSEHPHVFSDQDNISR